MAIRPIDVARQLKISTTTLRHYEEHGLVPPVERTESGYRMYTDEHLAYFVCVREMMAGFSLTLIANMLHAVQAGKTDAALWMATKAQAELQQEKVVSDKIVLNLLSSAPPPVGTHRERLTIHEVSRETGVPATTIRYWDKVGLLEVERDRTNRYRLFTAKHIQQILTIYALKFAVYSDTHQYSVERVKEELKGFDYNDRERIGRIVDDLKAHLDRVNRAKISSISALYKLCSQVETQQFGKPI